MEIKLSNRSPLGHPNLKDMVTALCFVVWQEIALSCPLGWSPADQGVCLRRWGYSWYQQILCVFSQVLQCGMGTLWLLHCVCFEACHLWELHGGKA